MLNRGWCAAAAVAVFLVVTAGCSKGSPFSADIDAISFETTTVPPADAGRLYNTVIVFATSGNAALPDRFEITKGVLPTGVTLERDRADLDFDGLPDTDGAYTGNARLLGTPRERGSFAFTLKAISTGALAGLAQGSGQPALSVSQDYVINVGEGAIAILNPTAAEGTKDPQVPAFPDVVPFVNPSNPKAFFSFAFLVAGGSGNNRLSIFAPRELELSVFDTVIVDDLTPTPEDLRQDTDESVTGPPPAGSPFANKFSDGGWFIQEGGTKKVQVGGFQSPRGPVRTDTDGDGVQDEDFMQTLLDQWFQLPATPKSGRRDLGDTLNLGGGDPTLGTAAPIQWSDYFNPGYKDTDSLVPDAERAKYGFTKDQYVNAFFAPFVAGDLTPLKFNIIVQAADTKGTVDKSDDVLARKNYLVQVQIPEVVIDTVFLPRGQTGVDYNEFVAASGGVPPLYFDLEWVDATADLSATVGDPLTKNLFGIDLEPTTGQFIGVPRAAAPDLDPNTLPPDGPPVELTVRVYADVMNPVQGGNAQVPTGTAGEFDGLSPVTNKKGRHKTFPVNFELPTAPMISNIGLAAGIDGVAYPGDRIAGAGGTPLLAPYPVGFFDNSPGIPFPSSTARRAYDLDCSYVLDASHPDPVLNLGNEGDTVQGQLPYNLTLVKSATLATNGNISGTPYDRGFHQCTFTGRDFYVGNVAAGPVDANAFRTSFQRMLALSISPDSALYMRGVQTSEKAGGTPSGLLDDTAQMGEVRMVPMFLAAGLYSIETGKSPVLFNSTMPIDVDLLPVMLPNGGSDTHNRKSIPSISGFWPAEADKWPRWYLNGEDGWKHLQQETCWIQAPDAENTRVFMWAQSEIKNFTNGTWTQKYQQIDMTGQRGTLVVKPLTGDFFVPAILDQTNVDHGQTFGAESVVVGTTNSATGGYYYYDGVYHRKYYYYPIRDTQHDREVNLHGTGAYIESYGTSYNSSNAWYKNSMGRSSTSVAMSADGKWCATALPGGSNTQKLLIWRTDKTDLSTLWGNPAFVTYLDGLDSDGSTLDNTAAIYRPADAAGATGLPFGVSQRYLLPDSLMFVENGLLFLNEVNLDHVFGISLEDGHMSGLSLNGNASVSRDQVNSAGIGITVNAARAGQWIPDQDYLRGFSGSPQYAVQFSFAGDKPDGGEEGPDTIALTAGINYVNTYTLASAVITDLNSTTHPRKGYAMVSNAAKSVFCIDLNTATSGLDLSSSTLKDLTGSDTRITGDILSPGRFGEEQDWLVLSDDGKYAAVVRDFSLLDSPQSTFGYRGTFHSPFYYYSGYDAWISDHDLMVISTDGSQMSTASGKTGAHILYLGTGSSSAGAGSPTLPAYADGRNHMNAAFRRINGLTFAADGRTLIFNYAGDNSYVPTSGGYVSTGWGAINPETSGTFGFGIQMSVRLHFRTTAGGPVDFSQTSNLKNNLQGLTGIGSIGPTGAPFGDVTNTSSQLFWATFKSADGNFLYMISDQLNGSTAPQAGNRNFMVGFNISANAINGRAPFVPFSPHASTIGFEQFDCNSWNYECRFAAVPGGVAGAPFDGAGILCVIASDSSAGSGSATDLEVYAMNANLGTNMIALTSAITTGSANAINYLYLSMDGNSVAGHRSATATSSVNGRSQLTGKSDLFVVTNIHSVLEDGAAPNAFVVSADGSHGATVAFVGDGTPAGAQALIFSHAASGGNTTWDDRVLRVGVLSPGAGSSILDSTKSHYVVLSGGRNVKDEPTSSN